MTFLSNTFNDLYWYNLVVALNRSSLVCSVRSAPGFPLQLPHSRRGRVLWNNSNGHTNLKLRIMSCSDGAPRLGAHEREGMEGSAERVQAIGMDECMNISAKASRIPFNAMSMECSYLSHSSPAARPGVGLRCGQWMRHHCIIHTCCCPCQRADSRVWVTMWNIKAECAIACRCGKSDLDALQDEHLRLWPRRARGDLVVDYNLTVFNDVDGWTSCIERHCQMNSLDYASSRSWRECNIQSR